MVVPAVGGPGCLKGQAGRVGQREEGYALRPGARALGPGLLWGRKGTSCEKVTAFSVSCRANTPKKNHLAHCFMSLPFAVNFSFFIFYQKMSLSLTEETCRLYAIRCH